MHCDSAPCIRAAKNGAVYKREDGIVIIDPEKASGQKELVKACPYGAIWWNEEKRIAQKCTLCAHLLDGGWKTPRCVQACPTGALSMLLCDDREMEESSGKEGLVVLHPEYKTRPRVYYRNLYRFDRCFVAASIAVEKQGVKDCVKGAAINLRSPSGKVWEAVSDAFGDFKLDGLEENSGRYTLEVKHPDFGRKTLEVEVTTSVSVGTIMMNDEI
jgi:ferredoxin